MGRIFRTYYTQIIKWNKINIELEMHEIELFQQMQNQNTKIVLL